MKHKNKILMTVCFFVLVCFGSNACAGAEPNEQEIQLAAEKMQQLKQAYKEYEEAIAYFLKVNEEAIQKQPALAGVETGLLRNDAMERRSLPGESEYRKYRRTSEDPNEVRRMFTRCRTPFGAKAMADALRDPNWAEELKPALLLKYRWWGPRGPGLKERFKENLKEKGYTVFDPTDPNDERLWKNIKRYEFEMAEHLEPVRRRFLEEEGVPKWLADYAGLYTLLNGTFTLHTYCLRLYTPEKVVDAAKRVRELLHKMRRIYPGWSNIQHLLTNNITPLDIDPSEIEPFFHRWGALRQFLAGEIDTIYENEAVDTRVRLYFTPKLADIILAECKKR